MKLIEIADVYLSPKGFIKSDVYSIDMARKDIRTAKKRMTEIKRMHPKTFRKRFGYRFQKQEIKRFNESIRHHKREFNKWLRIAKERKVKFTKHQMSDIRRLKRLI